MLIALVIDHLVAVRSQADIVLVSTWKTRLAHAP